MDEARLTLGWAKKFDKKLLFQYSFIISLDRHTCSVIYSLMVRPLYQSSDK